MPSLLALNWKEKMLTSFTCENIFITQHFQKANLRLQYLMLELLYAMFEFLSILTSDVSSPKLRPCRCSYSSTCSISQIQVLLPCLYVSLGPIPLSEDICILGCRTPKALLMTIQNLLDAFDTNRQGALLKEARKLIQPSVIGRLRAIKQEVESQYM